MLDDARGDDVADDEGADEDREDAERHRDGPRWAGLTHDIRPFDRGRGQRAGDGDEHDRDNERGRAGPQLVAPVAE